MPPTATTDGYLTKEQVCERFQKSHDTIQRWMHAGVLPFIKIGTGRTATILFDWEDIRRRLRDKFGVNVA